MMKSGEARRVQVGGEWYVVLAVQLLPAGDMPALEFHVYRECPKAELWSRYSTGTYGMDRLPDANPEAAYGVPGTERSGAWAPFAYGSDARINAHRAHLAEARALTLAVVAAAQPEVAGVWANGYLNGTAYLAA